MEKFTLIVLISSFLCPLVVFALFPISFKIIRSKEVVEDSKSKTGVNESTVLLDDGYDLGFANFEPIPLSDPNAEELLRRCVRLLKKNHMELARFCYLWYDRNGVMRLTDRGQLAMSHLVVELVCPDIDFGPLDKVDPRDMVKYYFG